MEQDQEHDHEQERDLNLQWSSAKELRFDGFRAIFRGRLATCLTAACCVLSSPEALAQSANEIPLHAKPGITAPITPHPPPLARYPAEALRLFNMRQLDAARLQIQQHLQSRPEDSAAIRLAGWIELEGRQWNLAIAHFQRAVTLEPTNAVHHLWLGRAHALLAREHGFPGGMSHAIRFRNAVERATVLDPHCTEAWKDYVGFLLEAPALVGGGRRKAEAAARTVTASDPYLGHVLSARVLMDQDKHADAERTLNRAIRLEPQRLEAHYVLAKLHRSRNQHTNALAVLNRIITLGVRPAEPYALRSDDAWYHFAQTSLECGLELPQAEIFLRRYLECHPDVFMPSLADAHVLLARFLQRQSKLAEALAACDAALQADPSHKVAQKLRRQLHHLTSSP